VGKWTNDATGAQVSVADEKDYRFASGWHVTGSTPKAERSDLPDASWKVAELKAYAEENGIDLLDATKKDDILAAIELYEPESSEGEDSEEDSEEEDEDESEDESGE
jgi:hypothetical protein